MGVKFSYLIGEVGCLYSCFLETVPLRKCQGELPKTVEETFGEWSGLTHELCVDCT